MSEIRDQLLFASTVQKYVKDSQAPNRLHSLGRLSGEHCSEASFIF